MRLPRFVLRNIFYAIFLTLCACNDESQHNVDDGKGFQLNRAAACDDILAKFAHPDHHLSTATEINDRFAMKKDLRAASKSGAFPAIVQSKKNHQLRFLKIFPAIKSDLSQKQMQQNQSFLEIFQSCRLAKLENGEHLSQKTSFFVDVYEFGFVEIFDPFTKTDGNKGYYPYLLAEAVDGITLTEVATKPEQAQKDLGFDIDSSPPMVLESILMQIIIALKQPNKAWDLVHNDLHPGNILLSKHERADFSVNVDGKTIKLSAPLVKIIDFGLGESAGFAQKKTPTFSVWIKNRPYIKELEHFMKTVRGKKGIALTTRASIANASKNQDLQMFNLIMRALKKKLNKRGSKVHDGKYCKTYDDCIVLISRWWP